jgi:RND family efflux transporter MFP subunit
LERHLTRKVKRGAVLALTIFAFASSGCGKHKDPADEPQSAESAVPDVTVTKVKRTVLASELIVSGNLSALPNNDAKLAALVPGRIAQVFVSEGEQVSSGKPLAELDNASLKDQVRQAEASVAQAQANVENSHISAQRNEGLLQRGIASRKEVEDARTQLAVNESALKQAEAVLSAAKTQLARSIIRAPFAGTIVHRFLGVGEQVDGTAAQPVVEVANIEKLELLGTVPASRLSEVRAGDEFAFQTSAVPDGQFTAQLVSVLPAVDPGTNNGSVRIRVSNPKHQLKLGMFITLNLPLKQRGPRLVVPRQAIYPDESGEPHVYKVNSESAEAVPVQLGAQSKDLVEVVSGVQEGDTVIVTGGYGLPEKAKVHVKQEAQKSE